MRGTMSSARRVLVGILTCLIALTSLLVAATVTAPTASAAVAPVEQRPSAGVTADALPTVQINGVVWDQEVVGDTVYAGGQFTSARPAGSPAGTNETPRLNLLAYNIRTGELITTFNPGVNGVVKDITASPDGSRIYVGGNFTKVGTVDRYRLAAFNTSNGSLVTTFAAGVNAGVNGITVSGSTVYVGGAFTSVGSNSRPHLAAFNASNGALQGWAPTVDTGSVNAIVLTPDRSRVIVAGSFSSVNGATATGLAAVDSATGALLPWAANQTVRNYGTSAAMLSLSTDGTTIYSAGYWFGGTGNFEGVMAADPNTGAIKWLADCHGDSYDAGVAAGAVYAVSHWHHCSNIGGFPDTNPRTQWYRSNAMTAEAKGTVDPNNQGGYANFQGQGAPAMINWFPVMDVGTFTGQSQAGWTTEGTSEYLVQGGEFLKVNGVPQQGLVRFAIPSLAPKKQGPRLTGADQNPSLLDMGNGSVRVKWQTNWDRDDQVLSYEVQRQGSATPLFTTSATSQFWNRPFLSFTDTTTRAGTAYSYRISAFDADGNRVSSNYVSITPSASSSAYVSQVIADGASNYWRMGNTGGFPDYIGDLDLAAGTGTSRNPAGAINGDPDGAATFDGTGNGTAGAPTTITSPNTFTAEAWFKTTSTTGGKIVGFGDSQLSQSSGYDRHVYLDNAGRVNFGVYPGAVRTVQSSASFNDGQWHHVAAQLSGAGMALYVDGLKVAANGSVTSGNVFKGRWRVGGDNLGGWTNQPSSYFLAGSIDDVAIYPTALSAAQLRDHYTKSGRTVAVPAAPTDGYGKAVYADDPTLFWRLDEASGTTARDASPNLQDGQFAGGVTYGRTSPVTGASGKAVGFNGADATVASSAQFQNPTTYSQELWFNTTTTSGGKLIGLGNTQSGTSSNYDRHVVMEADGRLTFGVWTGVAATITSPASYNDGQWHQVVSTQSAAGMRLYVDGALVGSNPETRAQDYSGFWRVGGDSNWCCQPWFNGSIDEVAVYDTALSAARVAAHYQASAVAPAPGNAAPVAAFTSDCTALTCTVDGSGSTDADGTVASYRWDFGDQTPAVTGRTPAAHTYAAAGTYQITLTVTDDDGATSTKVTPVTVAPAPNAAPTASFTNACSELACTFDGSASDDSDGTIASYAWDFGDGSTGSGATESHTYTATGTFLVKLTVTDNRGGTDTASRSITVNRVVNQAPVAAFTPSCTGLACTFDGSASSDPDGTLASRTWDFGDGSTGSGATESHTYASAGSYQVTLTVTDDKGSSSSRTATVVVSAANQAPTAAFTSSVSGSTVSFDAAGSTDADGTVASYAWAFGDSTTGTGRTTSRTYAAAGTYSVRLTVTDDDGATSSVTRSVTVAPAGATPIVADAFTRTTTRWGNADTGGTYTYSGSTHSTNGSTGNVRVTTAGTGATASLASVSARDLNLTADIAVDKLATGGGFQSTFITRKTGSSDYRMTLQHLSTGSVRLNLSRVVNGTATSLRDVNVTTATYTPGSVLKVRFTVTGNGTTALAGKVWRDGTTEPATAQITASDSSAALQTAGSFALYNYISGSATNAPVTWSLDNLRITAN